MNKLKKLLGHVVFIAGSLLVGGIAGYFIAGCMDAVTTRFPDMNLITALVLLLAIVALAFFLQLIIHEAGHLIFGLLSGYRFSSFRIGSLMWLQEDGKLRCKRLKIAGTGGQCLMAPPDMVDGKLPVILYNLGGAIINTVTAALFLALRYVLNGFPLLSMFCMSMATMGFATALINGIPLHTPTVDNDGYNAISLSKDSDAAAAFWVQMKVNEMISRGQRLKDMPDEWFTLPDDKKMKNSMIAATAVFACNRLMDQHRFAEAEELMRKYIKMDSAIVGIHYRLMNCDRIYLSLIGIIDADKADYLLDKEQRKFMRSMKKFPSVIRTEYVYALLGEENKEKAGAIAKEFATCAKTYPYPSDIESERELMEIADKVYEERTHDA